MKWFLLVFAVIHYLIGIISDNGFVNIGGDVLFSSFIICDYIERKNDYRGKNTTAHYHAEDTASRY